MRLDLRIEITSPLMRFFVICPSIVRTIGFFSARTALALDVINTPGRSNEMKPAAWYFRDASRELAIEKIIELAKGDVFVALGGKGLFGIHQGRRMARILASKFGELNPLYRRNLVFAVLACRR